MYSGTDGREFEADIFFGVVYYQRLRHMVADKYQVPSLPSLAFEFCLVLRYTPVDDDIMLCVSFD